MSATKAIITNYCLSEKRVLRKYTGRVKTVRRSLRVHDRKDGACGERDGASKPGGTQLWPVLGIQEYEATRTPPSTT